ncbi:FHA domain-containing protein, partial [Myxococcota bacterium]
MVWPMPPTLDRSTLIQTGAITSNLRGKSTPRRVICRVTAGPDRDRVVAIGSRAVVAGSEDTCDLQLSDQHVSRRHIEIRLVDGGVRVKDLGSTNGCFFQ